MSRCARYDVRIGQRSKTVLIQYMVGKGTMDDDMISSLHRKQSTLKSTVGTMRSIPGGGEGEGLAAAAEHRSIEPGVIVGMPRSCSCAVPRLR